MVSVLSLLRHGHENAITRRELCRRVGLTDRAVREGIEQLRHNGFLVANRQDGKGYFIPTETSDILAQYKQNEKRFKSIAHYQKFLREELKRRGTFDGI